MPTDIEKLVVQLSADFKKFESSMNRARSVSDRQFKAIETRAMQLDKRLSGIGTNALKALTAPIAGISAALSANEVLKYADAWTKAKNSLAVSGLVGEKQADVLDRLFQSAQRNATPIGALANLYGKASQASDNLGASQDDLIRFSDGVAVALRVAGTSSEEASGALTQLGQLLGSARVQAEEFNSVNEGARPILMAVASGLDAAGGSVNKLKQLVNDGQVSGKEFFDAFLKGFPAIEQMAANSSQTIAQGYTKVENALTRYVGETDASLGATQRLVQGLNALADNFDKTADLVLQLAAVMAGALVGRSIAGMISKLALAGTALKQFITLLRQAQRVTAFQSLATAAGPVGAAIGAVVTVAAIFATRSTEASRAAEGWAAELDKVRGVADKTTEAVKKLNEERGKQKSQEIQNKIDFGQDEIDSTKEALDRLFDTINEVGDNMISADVKKEIAALRKGLYDGSIAASEVKRQLDGMGKNNQWIDRLISDFDRLLDRFGLSAKAIQNLKDGLKTITLSPSVNPSHAAGDTVYSESQKRDAFFKQRDAEAMKNDLEKNVDTRAKAIIDAAAKLGIVLTEAAAKIQARTEIASESITQANTAAAGTASDLIKQFEGFRSNPYFDKNHLRVGYGSDTVTLADGSVREVVAGMKVSVTDANRDLIRRIGDFQDGIRGQIGTDTFNAMTEQQKAALTSIAYNYGDLPDRIVNAIKTGDAGTVSQAINGLGTDNGGINASRRAQEAQLYLNGASPGVQARVQGETDFSASLQEQQQMIAALKAETGIRASLNPLLNDYGKKLSEVEKAQELLRMAQQEGTAAGKELTDVQQLLNGDLTNLSPAAQAQAEAMRTLAQEYGNATAASNQLQASQEKIATSTANSLQLQKDIVSGALTDIRSAFADGKITAKEWGDVVINMLGKVADSIQNQLVNALFSANSAGGGFNLFGLLGGGGSGFNLATATPGLFSEGGYTGAGGKYQPAGIVHKGEYVFDQDAVKRIGVDNLRMLQRGYANGGLVGGAPTLPRLPSRQRDGLIVDNRLSLSVDDDGMIRTYVDRKVNAMGKAVEASTRKYTKGQMHRDINRHNSSPRRIG